MSARTHALQAKAAAPATAVTGLLQRACACGDHAGASGKCEACEAEARFGPSPLQPKLRVGAPGDSYEREADSVAAQVLGAGSGATALPAIRPLVQRDASGAGLPVPDQGFAARLGAENAGGRPLPSETRALFEPRFGRDLGHVRVHDGAASASLAQDIDARAFTHGAHIHFAPGQYDPQSGAGRHLLAHEMTHTIQQGAGQSGTLQRDWTGDAGKWIADKVVSPETQEFLKDLKGSIVQAPNHALAILGEVWESIKAHWIAFSVTFLGFLGAESLVGSLTAAPEPTFLTKVAAFILQSLLAAAFLYFGGVELWQVITHATAWWKAVGAAHGDPGKIAEASKSFCRMLLHIALLILSIIGAKAKLRGVGKAGQALVEGTEGGVEAGVEGGVTGAKPAVEPAPVTAKPAVEPAPVTAKPAVEPVAPPKPAAPPPAPARPALKLIKGGGGKPAVEPAPAPKATPSGGQGGKVYQFRPKAPADPAAPSTPAPPAPRLRANPSGPAGGGGSGSGGGGKVYTLPRAKPPGAVRPAASGGASPRATGPGAFEGSGALKTSPEFAPEIAPEIAPEVAPEIAPEVAPEIAPEVAPEVAPEIAPEVAPEVTPEAAPEAPGEAAPSPSPDSAATPRQRLTGAARRAARAAALAAAAAARPETPELPQGVEIRLVLPPEKAVHWATYRDLIFGRQLEHRVGRPDRETTQADKWDEDVDTEMSDPNRIWALYTIGLCNRERLRPSWTRERLSPTHVDHIIEHQVSPIGREALIDEPWNFELLDQSSNTRAGRGMQTNITDERNRLVSVTGNPAWALCDIQFTRLIVTPPGRAGRWSKQEVIDGEHLREFRRQKLNVRDFCGADAEPQVTEE